MAWADAPSYGPHWSPSRGGKGEGPLRSGRGFLFILGFQVGLLLRRMLKLCSAFTIKQVDAFRGILLKPPEVSSIQVNNGKVTWSYVRCSIRSVFHTSMEVAVIKNGRILILMLFQWSKAELLWRRWTISVLTDWRSPARCVQAA